MKKIFVTILFLSSLNLFAQDWDENDNERKHHKEDKYKKDYFSIGLYGGGHTSNSLHVTEGPFNCISFELEYTKSKNWGFFIKGIYEFTPQTVQELFFNDYEYLPELFNVQNPTAFIYLFNFGARYYVTRGKVSPYFSAGISNEASFIGKYQYSIPQGQNSYSTAYGKNTFNTFISLNFGTGLNFRLSEVFSLDMQYDVYQYLGKNNYHNAGYSGLIGLKYNL